MKTFAVLAVLVLGACATPKEEVKPGRLQVIGHQCDSNGVRWLRVMVDGPTVSTIEWDNTDVCGDPT